jgi:LacI family transcriptional regulator
VIITRYASAMITGALDIAHATDHTLLISEANGDPTRMAEAVEATLDRRADGMIFALMSARLVELPPLPAGLKVVLLNATGSKGEPAVLPAEYEAGFGIAAELLEAGHREIAIVGHPPDHWLRALRTVTVGTRLNGIRAAFQQAAVQPALRLDAEDWEPEVGYDLARRVLTSAPQVTALLCLNDRLAFGAYQALQEAGVAVPAEMSVASFDDDELAHYLRPGLTTAGIPYRDMGRRAMRMLLDGETPEAPVQLPMPIRRRGSVGPPRSA